MPVGGSVDEGVAIFCDVPTLWSVVCVVSEPPRVAMVPRLAVALCACAEMAVDVETRVPAPSTKG